MKKLCYILLTAALLLGLSTAAVAETRPVVIDGAGLLTAAETDALTDKLTRLRDTYGIDAVVLTTDSLGGQSAVDYADDYYDQNGYGNDGVLLLVAMDERQWRISTCGSCNYSLDADTLEGWFLSSLSSADYYDAFSGFADGCEAALTGTYQGSEAQRQGSAQTVLICLGIGIAVGLIAVLIMRGQLKTVRSQNTAGSYVVSGLQLTGSTDMFLYHTTTRRAKPQNNTTHRSSSGRSHGGGGGRF